MSFVIQIQGLEESAELLRERSLKFYKGCRKYTYVYFGIFDSLFCLLFKKYMYMLLWSFDVLCVDFLSL